MCVSVVLLPNITRMFQRSHDEDHAANYPYSIQEFLLYLFPNYFFFLHPDKHISLRTNKQEKSPTPL